MPPGASRRPKTPRSPTAARVRIAAPPKCRTPGAVAISSVISVPREFHQAYFDAAGEMVNPWGGVEAMLTHAISSRFNVPSAHSPMFEAEDISNQDPGVVDPRMAAEAISLTFFQSVLKGLHKSPRIVTDLSQISESGVLSAADVSCLVIPDGCVGLPTLAALEQGIPVVAVRENKNLMKNDLQELLWRTVVENYWEAVGVLCAIRSGNRARVGTAAARKYPSGDANAAALCRSSS